MPSASLSTKQKILETARRLLVERGYHEIVMDDIAQGAGVAKGTLFLHYRTKEDLFFHAFATFRAAGKANGAQVIPVGLAFARAIAMKPDLELYVADKRHPTLAGTYLAACTSYAALYGKSPVGLSYIAGLPADTARLLQTAAWETVQAFGRP